MKNIFRLLIAHLFLCSQNITAVVTKPVQIIKLENECVFDLATQTDEFLKNNAKINNYEWTDSIHSGIIILNNSDTIRVNKGGCNHFNFFCELTSKNIDTLEINNESFGLKKAKELVHLIFPESDAKLLDSLITTSDFDTEIVDGPHFEFEEINRVFNYKNHCSTTLFIKRLPNGFYKLEIGYYLC
jgi:hypothetical protein